MRLLGNGVTTYIVLPTTSGWPSCPCAMPVENVVTTCRFIHVGGGDRVERAVAEVAVVAGRHPPFGPERRRDQTHRRRRPGHGAAGRRGPPPVAPAPDGSSRPGRGNSTAATIRDVSAVPVVMMAASIDGEIDLYRVRRSDSRSQAANSTRPPAARISAGRDPHQAGRRAADPRAAVRPPVWS